MQMLIIKLLCAGLAIPASRQRRRLRSLGAAGRGGRGLSPRVRAGAGLLSSAGVSVPPTERPRGGSLLRTLSLWAVVCPVPSPPPTFLLFLAAG